MGIGGNRRWVWLAVVAMLAVAAMAGGCGGSDDDEPAGGGSAAADVDGGQSSAGGEQPDGGGSDASDQDVGGPEGEIRALYERFVEVVYDGDAQAACSLLAPAARKKFADGRDSCEAAMKVRLDPKKLSKNRPYLVGVKIRGEKALARGKTKNSNTYPIPLVKQGGEWKINGGF